MSERAKYKITPIEKNIKYIECSNKNRTPYYYVSVCRKGKYFNRSFHDLESAKKYRDDFIVELNKERLKIEPVEEKYEYPQNAINAIFTRADGLEGVNINYLYENFEENINWLFENNKRLANPIFKEVFFKRFKEYKTLDAIGKEEGLSKERIRQIESEYLRVLKHPLATQYLIYGYEVVGLQNDIKVLKEKLKAEKEFLTKELYKLESENANELENMLEIEQLNLSNGAYNVLRRAGIKYAGELKNCTLNSLMRIRACGKGKAREILEALREAGIQVAD